MKRISTLFSLLLFMLGAMTVYAQTPSAAAITSEVVPNGYYFIASSAESAYSITSPYLAANSNSMKLVAKTDVTTNVSTSTVGLWYIKQTGTDGSDNHPIYSIQSMEGDKLYWSVGQNCPLGSTVGIYRIGKDAAGNYYFYGNGTANNVTNTARVNATSATSFNRNDNGSYTTWKLIPAGVKDISLVYNNGKRSFTQSKSMVAVGSNVSTNLNLDFYDSFDPSTVTVTDNENSYTVNCTTSFPFDEGNFYTVKLRWAGENWNGDNAKDNGIYTNRSLVWDGVAKSQISTRAIVTQSNNGLWCLKFVEGTPNQVYLCSALNAEHARVCIDNTNNHTKAYINVVGTPFICKKGNTSANYSNGFRLQALSNENANLNDDDGKLGYWTDGGSKTNDGSTLTLYEPTSSPELVSDYTVVATNSATNEQITFAGEPFVVTNTGNDKFATNGFISVSNINYNKDTQTLSLDYTSTAPYQLSGEETTAKHWQVIRSRKDDTHYLKANGNSIQSRSNSLNRSSLSEIKKFNANDANQWAIIPAAGFDKFYLVNKATVGKAYLASETQGAELVMSSEHATPLYLNAQPTFNGITGGFTIQPNASNSHAIGDHLSANLSYWSNRSGDTELHDDGSIFRVADLLADSKAIVNANTDYLGSVSESARGTLNAITGVSEQSRVSEFFTKYDELAATPDFYTAPANDKIYRIRVNRYSGNIYACFANAIADSEGNVKQGYGNTPRERLLGFTDTESAMTYVRFIKQDGGYYLIQDVNSKFYYGSRAEDVYSDNKLYAVFNSEFAGHYTIENSINGTLTCVALKENKATDITKQYLWCRGDDESGALGQYNYFYFHSPYKDNATTGDVSKIEPGCVYRVQAVSTYPVTFKAEYSTLNLPFDVTLPENVEAYVVSSVSENTVGEHRELVLNKVEGTVHANTPVILRCTNSMKPTSEEPVSVNLGVTGATTQAEGVNNILSGSTVKRTEFGEVSYYALANKALTEGGEKQIGFFRVATQTMPANKAYLLRSSIPASAGNAMALLFNFDGDTITGIGNAVQTKAQGNEVYYDLNGRRVLYPTHGIYVKGNGQKVFIK